MTKQRGKGQPKTTTTTTSAKDDPPANTRVVPSINLRTKYYSVVPLHLLFIHFTVYYLPGKILSSPEDGHPAAAGGIGPSVQHLVRHPIRSLALINLGTLLVQLWFTNFLRSWRNSLVGPADPSASSEKRRPLPEKRVLASQLKRLFLSLISAPPSEFPKRLAKELDPKLRALISRATLLLKEALLINTVILLALTALLVLLGASTSSLSQLLKNLGLACFLGLLAFFPASLLLGWNQAREKPNWIRIFSTFQPKNEVEVALLFPAFGACIGTWLGAIPIPLDWDRPWQAWPITCLVGASVGHAIGSVASVIHSALYSSP
ncbi:hypothetical protein PTTG_08643 [Puccinia triticina 1-1 BBBD Race 1]|uniref:Glycosylphosphatidylinositol anchor biosynthesis protein 11 n=2 Tax=Puccinia triticina TaxID=208348 RepID=A0A0C4F679_PUCT1|nr:uncharacterized protein PtA15_1A520 [Puccinia triticina]OAV87292.1 hypothetical protein PTTG_08643 [Puccinia triticina 1-1 BBBD Race 1]WAQ81181.1 hypothetical protein PtA15_1A520 [Puccinia triticina]WAR52077.1 hypothetical protein PtB15_1B516 [Puccinia triticina]